MRRHRERWLSAIQDNLPHQRWNFSAPWSWSSSPLNCEKIDFYCVSLSIYGALLWQPKQNNAPFYWNVCIFSWGKINNSIPANLNFPHDDLFKGLSFPWMKECVTWQANGYFLGRTVPGSVFLSTNWNHPKCPYREISDRSMFWKDMYQR